MDETVTGREEDPHERARFFMNLPPVSLPRARDTVT